MSRKKRFFKYHEKQGLTNKKCYVSYGREGLVYANRLKEILTNEQFVIQSDYHDIVHGTNWLEVIREDLQHIDAFILIVTPDVLTSKWVLAEIDFIYNLRRNCIFIPILFQVTDIQNIPFVLRDFLWLQEFELNYKPSEKVVEAILTILKSDSSKPTHYQLSKKTNSSVNEKLLNHVPTNENLPLNEGKLILVGRGEVGKTSIVRRLVQNDFKANESKTDGINITKWLLQCSLNKYRINIWDFGGQEMMHATHQFFLTERSIYLLVLNGREGGEDIDAEYWLKHIESFGGNSPVIVVQNKIEEHPFELNYRGLNSRYSQIRCFIKTDCQTNIGIDELHKVIKGIVEEMPEIRMLFPKDWFTVKQRLESIYDEYMGYEKFVQLCHSVGIRDENDQNTLGWVLHCLGIALNYRHDSRLRETSVLKPEWVTHGIYKILNAHKISEHQGELHISDVSLVLPRDRYPLDKHFFLLELMRKFSLCFAFPDDDSRYLIPELLGKEEPKEVMSFLPENCLNFEYHYEILPEGLIPRFIVRSHTLSQKQPRWRSGVILLHEGCRALVKSEIIDRKIIVRVHGEDSGSRRRLLAIIRYDIEKINLEFKDRLNVQAKVPLREYPEFSVEYNKLVAFEKQGVKSFPEVINKQVIQINVGDLLNGVDLDKQREKNIEILMNPKSVFFSYSHKDESLRDELETHLKLLQRQNIISTWHDRKILPGDVWNEEIDVHIERARVILLLISADFLASDYCWGVETKKAMERHEAGEAVVVPIILRSCDWRKTVFGKLQGLPKDMHPVASHKDRDVVWTKISIAIRAIAEKL